MPEINVLVEGGKAIAGAPLGPALGSTGVNIGAVVTKINEKTKNFVGTKVPVKVIVDVATKSFEIEVGSPPMSALIKKELNIQKGAANPKTVVAGNLSMQQVKKISEMKIESLNSLNLFGAAREVIGTANSMGVQIEGKHAKVVQTEFEEGKYDSFFDRKKSETKESFVEEMVKAGKDIIGAVKEEVQQAEKALEGITKKA